jgi:hypothetical protein
MATDKVCGTNSGGLEKVKAHLAGAMAATEIYKNSNDKVFKETLRKEQEKAQAAVDKHANPPHTQGKTRAVLQDALDAVAPAEEQRVAKAKDSSERANNLHVRSMDALRTYAAGILDLGKRMEERHELAKGQWQQLNEMLHTESSQLGTELQDRLRKMNMDKTYNAAEAIAEQAVHAANVPLPSEHPITDTYRCFEASIAEVPAFNYHGPQEVQLAGEMWGFFTSMKEMDCLPPMTFHDLGVIPGHFHTLVGDSIWNKCWGNQQGSIHEEHFVPHKLMKVLQALVTSTDKTPEAIRSQAYLSPGLCRPMCVQEKNKARQLQQ